MTWFETERLLLREPEPGDLDAFAAIFADPEVIRHLGGFPAPATRFRSGSTT